MADIIPFSMIVLLYFVKAIIGHMVGDYLLQNQWMATKKSLPGKDGDIACTVHVLLYTLSIGLCTGLWNLMFLSLVFLPHWIIDRWSLARYWLDFKNRFGTKESWLGSPFAYLNYAANDNTLHFICLWFTLQLYFWLVLFSQILQ